MNKFKRFLANLKGSAFIENLMVYITVAVIGLIVVGIIGKTINDAAAGSKYQDEIVVNGGNSNQGNDSNASDQSFFEQTGMWPGNYPLNDGMLIINNDNTAILQLPGNDVEEYRFTYEPSTNSWNCPDLGTMPNGTSFDALKAFGYECMFEQGGCN